MQNFFRNHVFLCEMFHWRTRFYWCVKTKGKTMQQPNSYQKNTNTPPVPIWLPTTAAYEQCHWCCHLPGPLLQEGLDVLQDTAHVLGRVPIGQLEHLHVGHSLHHGSLGMMTSQTRQHRYRHVSTDTSSQTRQHRHVSTETSSHGHNNISKMC